MWVISIGHVRRMCVAFLEAIYTLVATSILCNLLVYKMGKIPKTKLTYDDYLTSVYSCNHNLLDSMTFILLVFPFCFLHTICSFPFLSIFQFKKIHFVVILLLLCFVNMKSKYPVSFCCYRWRSNKNCFVFNFHTLGTWLQINPTDTCHLALGFMYFGRKAIGR